MNLQARHVLFLASLRGEPQSVEVREKEGRMGKLKVGQNKSYRIQRDAMTDDYPAQPVIKGKAMLDGAGEWQPVTEENKTDMRFFKVEVVLP